MLRAKTARTFASLSRPIIDKLRPRPLLETLESRTLLSDTPATAIISGNVFNDANGDGIRQSTEHGIPNITVYLDTNNNGSPDPGEVTTTTDTNGHYQFLVIPNTYEVREVLPTGSIQTTPANNAGY